jgi:putative protease
MNRSYKGRTLELLAPAGTMAILEALADSGTDAFYVGGKSLNMRLHRRDLNFSGDELVAAGGLCREKGLRLYVTVNKLMGDDDLAEAPGYLEFLARDVRPDAILVQDMAIPAIVAQRRLGLAMHASVMMNAHDLPGIRALAALGFSRVVMSRESSLADCMRLGEASGMELEYFAHGDLCATHGSQCLYSGMLFGQSSNRGLCMKPCRWPFKATMGGRLYGSGFPLAVRDMCLYLDLQAAADSGISSFKLEGRMRSADYLRPIISAYAGSLDRLVASDGVASDGVASAGVASAGSASSGVSRAGIAGSAELPVETTVPYDPRIGYEALFANRMRDFTTAFAYGRPGSSMLNKRWEGTGKFYSSGKVFSHAAEEPGASPADAAHISKILRSSAVRARPGQSGGRSRPQLAVRVDGTALAGAAFEAGADVAIISGEPLRPLAGAAGIAPFVPIADLESLRKRHPDKIVCLALPRMLEDDDYPAWEQTLRERAGLFDELYVTQLGSDDAFRHLAPRLSGDSSLNILNKAAAATWAGRGLSSVCASIEAGAADLVALVSGSPVPVELIAHGRPTAMYIGLDLASYVANLPPSDPAGAVDGVARDRALAFGTDVIVLIDEHGSPHPVVRDCRDKYHLLPTKAIALLPLAPALIELGVARFRIDCALYDEPTIRALCSGWRAALDGADPASLAMPGEIEGSWFSGLRPSGLRPSSLKSGVSGPGAGKELR